MKPLTISEAHKFYFLIKPHLPEEFGDGVTFMKSLITSIESSDNPGVFIELLAILNQTDSDTIIRDLDPKDSAFVFMQGIEVNRLSNMIAFFRGLEHG